MWDKFPFYSKAQRKNTQKFMTKLGLEARSIFSWDGVVPIRLFYFYAEKFDQDTTAAWHERRSCIQGIRSVLWNRRDAYRKRAGCLAMRKSRGGKDVTSSGSCSPSASPAHTGFWLTQKPSPVRSIMHGWGTLLQKITIMGKKHYRENTQEPLDSLCLHEYNLSFSPDN